MSSTKHLPTPAKVSTVLSCLQLVAAIVAAVSLWNFDDNAPATTTYWIGLAAYMLYVLALLPNAALVAWELLIALKTKRHFWLQYALFLLAIALAAALLLLAPHSTGQCGCAA
jgi:hypothetical protein